MESDVAVLVEGATKRFGGVVALDQVTLSVDQGAFVSVLGQSGSGKTTLLRAIAGLEELDDGAISIAGQDMSSLPAQARPVNTVFQSYALFPHMTVRANVGFGLRMHGIVGADLDRRVDRILESLGIANLADRRPAHISGGESQRTALARALVNEPAVLLLDEPLSALDPRTRIRAREELRHIAAQSGTTFIMVTHDQSDAFALSSRIALMSHGRLIQVGTPQQLYFEPDSIEAAEAFGVTNLFSGAVAQDGEPVTVQSIELGTSLRAAPCKFPVGQPVTIMIRPEAVNFGAEPPSDQCGSVRAVIEASRFVGEAVEYDLRLGTGKVMLARRAEPDHLGRRDDMAGAEVCAWWRTGDVRLMAI